MGQPKLLLPLGGRTILEWVVAALRTGGAEHVIVVIGPHVAELQGPAKAAGAEICMLHEPTPNMRATVEHGLRWLEERYQPGSEDAFLLAPADHPMFEADVVRSLCTALLHDPTRSIFIPVHAGRRGHPTLIRWRHVSEMMSRPAQTGINSYLRECSEQIREIPVADPGVLCDLDTPEDYRQLQQLWAGKERGHT